MSQLLTPANMATAALLIWVMDSVAISNKPISNIANKAIAMASGE